MIWMLVTAVEKGTSIFDIYTIGHIVAYVLGAIVTAAISILVKKITQKIKVELDEKTEKIIREVVEMAVRAVEEYAKKHANKVISSLEKENRAVAIANQILKRLNIQIDERELREKIRETVFRLFHVQELYGKK